MPEQIGCVGGNCSIGPAGPGPQKGGRGEQDQMVDLIFSKDQNFIIGVHYCLKIFIKTEQIAKTPDTPSYSWRVKGKCITYLKPSIIDI